MSDLVVVVFIILAALFQTDLELVAILLPHLQMLESQFFAILYSYECLTISDYNYNYLKVCGLYSISKILKKMMSTIYVISTIFSKLYISFFGEFNLFYLTHKPMKPPFCRLEN